MKLSNNQKNMLKDCFYCGKRSGTEEPKCPFCGRSKRETPKERGFDSKVIVKGLLRMVLWFLLMASVIVIMILNGLFS